MAKIGTVVFTGTSGKKYTFDVYKWGTSFRDDLAAVYCVTKQDQNTSGQYSHTVIYVGETGELGKRFENHHKKDCFEDNNANCVCILGESNEQTRLKIEADLVGNYDPPCNG